MRLGDVAAPKMLVAAQPWQQQQQAAAIGH